MQYWIQQYVGKNRKCIFRILNLKFEIPIYNICLKEGNRAIRIRPKIQMLKSCLMHTFTHENFVNQTNNFAMTPIIN